MSFDLDSYISRYPSTSETRLQRLLFIAHQFHSSTADGNNGNETASQAFQMAIAQMKSTQNHRRYIEEFEDSSPESTSPARGSSSPHRPCNHGHVIQNYAKYDARFVSESTASMQAQLEMLEGRLGTAQSHINKESIRSALLALGEFLRMRGEAREGWRRVTRSRYVYGLPCLGTLHLFTCFLCACNQK